MTLYKSRTGEINSKEVWITWWLSGFSYEGSAPVDLWERLQKVLKLEILEDNHENFNSNNPFDCQLIC